MTVKKNKFEILVEISFLASSELNKVFLQVESVCRKRWIENHWRLNLLCFYSSNIPTQLFSSPTSAFVYKTDFALCPFKSAETGLFESTDQSLGSRLVWVASSGALPAVSSLSPVHWGAKQLCGEQLTRVRAFHCSSRYILMTLIVISSWYQQCRMHTILQQSTMLFPQQCTQQWISPQQCTQQSTMHSPVCLLTWLNLFNFTNNYPIVRLLSLHC